jgi:hypothetical protein
MSDQNEIDRFFERELPGSETRPLFDLAETPVRRRLAAVDLVIALRLGHGAPTILSTSRGADGTCRPLVTAKSRPI